MKDNYAIVETGGKQYKVASGEKVNVDYLGAGEGKPVDLSRVLVIADGEEKIIGTPTIENARVSAVCLNEGKGKKVTVFKYKNKVRYRVKKGHRQPFTRLEIKEIVKPGGAAVKKAKSAKEVSGGKS
jgi:large subunit ribosomal protein L21